MCCSRGPETTCAGDRLCRYTANAGSYLSDAAANRARMPSARHASAAPIERPPHPEKRSATRIAGPPSGTGGCVVDLNHDASNAAAKSADLTASAWQRTRDSEMAPLRRVTALTSHSPSRWKRSSVARLGCWAREGPKRPGTSAACIRQRPILADAYDAVTLPTSRDNSNSSATLATCLMC